METFGTVLFMIGFFATVMGAAVVISAALLYALITYMEKRNER